MRVTVFRVPSSSSALSSALSIALALGACAGPPLAVPDADRLDASQRDAYRAALAAWIVGDAEATRAQLAALIAIEPWYVPAHTLEQDALAALGERRPMLVRYRAEVAAHPGDAARVLLAGRLADDPAELVPAAGNGEREPSAREVAYRRAHRLDPASPWPTIALSFELNRAALAIFERSVELADRGYPDDASAERGRAERLHEESRVLAEQVVAEYPALAEAHAGAAEMLMTRGSALGERDTLLHALGLAERAAELDPANPARFVLIARIRRQLIDDPGAEVALRRALELDDDDPDLLAGLGRVLLDLGRPEQARDALRRARRERPRDLEINVDLGVAEQRMGDLDAAVQRLEWAAGLDASDPRPLEALALVEMERGDRASARRALREYLLRGGEDRAWAAATLEELAAEDASFSGAP